MISDKELDKYSKLQSRVKEVHREINNLIEKASILIEDLPNEKYSSFGTGKSREKLIKARQKLDGASRCLNDVHHIVTHDNWE